MKKRNQLVNSQKSRKSPEALSRDLGFKTTNGFGANDAENFVRPAAGSFGQQASQSYDGQMPGGQTSSDPSGFRHQASSGFDNERGFVNPASFGQQDARSQVVGGPESQAVDLPRFGSQEFPNFGSQPTARPGFRHQNSVQDSQKPKQGLDKEVSEQKSRDWQEEGGRGKENRGWEKETTLRGRRKGAKRNRQSSGYTVNVFDNNGGKSYTIVDGLSHNQQDPAYSKPTQFESSVHRKPLESSPIKNTAERSRYVQQNESYRGNQEQSSLRRTKEQSSLRRTPERSSLGESSFRRTPEESSSYRRAPLEDRNQSYQSYRHRHTKQKR